MPLPSDFQKTAITTAYLNFYGKPYSNDSTAILYRASNRYYHGIMHAIGCMELILPVHNLYKKHVSRYEESLELIGNAFGFSIEELITLVQIAALFHDSGRQDEGDDYWDAESGENLYQFLIQHEVDETLAFILKQTIAHKDNADKFNQNTIQWGLENLDYLRQLVNSADTLEVIRVRNIFYYRYLPIMNISAEQLLQPQQLVVDVDHLITTTAQRIYYEWRGLPYPYVERKDGTQFAIHYDGIERMPSIDHAFADYCKNQALDLPRPESSKFTKLDKSRLNLIEAEAAAIKIQRAYGIRRSFKTTERQAEVNPSKVSSRNLALLRQELKKHVGFSDINLSTLNERGLTEEEELVYQYLLHEFPWTLKHRTEHLSTIQATGNTLKSLEERNRKVAYNSNSHTHVYEARLDNVYFSVGSPATPTPLFLRHITGHSIEIPVRAYLNKNDVPHGQLAGLWLSSHWWMYISQNAHRVNIGNVVRIVNYFKDETSEFLSPKDFQTYTYTLEDKQLVRTLQLGEETVTGQDILPFLAMSALLELRFTEPYFRINCLKNMKTPEFDAFIDVCFFVENCEALLPKSFDLNDANVIINAFGRRLENNPENINHMREAIISDSINAVQSLLNQGVSIEIDVGEHQTPLIFAITSHKTDIALFLIKMGANTLMSDLAPLCIAIANNDYEVVRAILTTPTFDVRSKIIAYHTHINNKAIKIAIQYSNLVMLNFLFNFGVDFTKVGCDVLTGILEKPTLIAIYTLRYLKDHGFNFSSVTRQNSIVLFDLLRTCLEQQKSELFEEFLLQGVNPNLSIDGAPSLLDLSTAQNANVFTNLLISHGAEPSLNNKKNNHRDEFYVHLLIESHAGDLLLVKERYHDGSLSKQPHSLYFQTHLISNDVIAKHIFRAIGVSAKFNIQWQESGFNGDVVIKLNFLQEVLPRETDYYGKTRWLSKASSQSENHDSFTTRWLESASKERFIALLENRNQLITAIEQDNIDLASEIIKKGTYDPQGKALLSACDKPVPNLKLIELLLSHGYDINAREASPLIHAIIHDNKGLLIFLINHGAEVNLQINLKKYTPLICAAMFNNIELMDVLENHGASYKHPHNRSILAAACASDITDKTFDYLLSKAELNAEFQGLTPLLICSENQEAYRVKALLQHGVDTETIHPVKQKIAKDLFENKALFEKYAPAKMSRPISWLEFSKHPITYLKLAQKDQIDEERLSREYGFVTQDIDSSDHLVATFLNSYDITCFKPFKLVITTEGNTPVFTCPGFASTVIAIHKDFLMNPKSRLSHLGFALLHELIKNTHYTPFQCPQKKDLIIYDYEAVKYTGFNAGIAYLRMADEFYQAHHSLENFAWPAAVYVNRPWDQSHSYDARIKALKLKHAESQSIEDSPPDLITPFSLLPEIEHFISYQYFIDFNEKMTLGEQFNYVKQQLPHLCDEFLPFQLTGQPSQALKQYCRLLVNSNLEESMLDELLILAEEIKLPGFSYLYKYLAGLPGMAEPYYEFSKEQKQRFKFLGHFKTMHHAITVFMQSQNPEAIHHAATQMMTHYMKIRHHFKHPQSDHENALISYVKNNHTLPKNSLEHYTHLGPIFMWPQYSKTTDYQTHLDAAKHYSDDSIWQALWILGEWENEALYDIIPVEFLKIFILQTPRDDMDGLMPLQDQLYGDAKNKIRKYLAKTTNVIFFKEHPNSCEELLYYIKQNAAHLYNPSVDKGKQATSILLESFSLFIKGNDGQKNFVLDYFTKLICDHASLIEQITPSFCDVDQYVDFIITHKDFFTPNALYKMITQLLLDESPQKWSLLFRTLGFAQWETNYSQWVALIEFFSAGFFNYPILSLLTNSYWQDTHEFSALDKQTVKLMELLPLRIPDSLLNNKLKFTPVNQCQLDLDKSIILYRYLDSRFIFPNKAYEQQLADYIIDNIQKISDPSVQLALLIRLMDADDGIYIHNITFTAKLINVYCQILSRVLGQDDSSLHYYKSAQPYLSHIIKHCQHQDAVKLFAKIADTILAQKHVSNLMSNLLEPKISEQFTQQFAPIYISMCQLLSILGKKKDDKFKTIHFISSPLSAKSLEAFALFIWQHPKFNDLMIELRLHQHTGLTIEVIKNSLTIFYQQFWNVDIQMRAILLDHLMITAQEDSRQETQIKAYQLGFDYMVGKLFPDAAENSRTHFALALLSSYLKTAHPSKQQFLLAAMLVVTKASQNNASLGKKFALLCEHMGPAYIKLAQAIHSHPDTPTDIKADLSHVKGHANPPYRWHLWRLAMQTLPRNLFERIKSLGKLLGSASYNLAIECKTAQHETLVLTLLREGAEEEAIKGFAHLKRTLDDCQHPLFLQNKDTFIRMIEEADLMSKNELDHNIGLKQHLLAAKKYKTTITLPSSEPGSPLYSVHFQACRLYECGPGYKLLSEMPGVEFNALPEDESILKNVVAKAVIGKELRLLLSGMEFDCDRHGHQLRVTVAGQNIYLGLFDFGEMSLAPLTETELRSTAELLSELPRQLAKQKTRIDDLFQKHIKTAISKGESYRHLIRFNKALLALQDFREHITAKEFKNIIMDIKDTAHPLFKAALDNYWQTLNWWEKSMVVGTALIENVRFFKRAPPQEELKEEADEPLVFEPTKKASS